jgi:hypothetical protein
VLVSHRAEKFDLEIRPPVGDAIEVHRGLDHTKLDRNTPGSICRYPRWGTQAIPAERRRCRRVRLAAGKDAGEADYVDALQHLGNESDVDMVLAAVQDFSNVDAVTRIYSAVIAHCDQMSSNSQGRVGFGQVPPTAGDVEAKKMAPALLSDRFVLLAPHGVVGAVAGRIGSLGYFESPTFKTISGIGSLSRALPLEEQAACCRPRWCRSSSSVGVASSSCVASLPMAIRSACGGSPTGRYAASGCSARCSLVASTARTAGAP